MEKRSSEILGGLSDRNESKYWNNNYFSEVKARKDLNNKCPTKNAFNY